MKRKESVGNEGWILDEDRALRDLMDDIYVSDDKRERRKVGVWFGHPDKEIRDQRYPYITIDLVDIAEELDRAERGYYEYSLDEGPLPRFCSGLDYADPSDTKTAAVGLDVPIPIRLTYSVNTWARNPRHDRQILQNLLQRGITRFQRSSLPVSDGTVRRLDVLDVVKRDSAEENRRLLSNSVVLGVSSEVPWGRISYYRRVSQVRLRITVDSANEDVYSEERYIP